MVGAVSFAREENLGDFPPIDAAWGRINCVEPGGSVRRLGGHAKVPVLLVRGCRAAGVLPDLASGGAGEEPTHSCRTLGRLLDRTEGGSAENPVLGICEASAAAVGSGAIGGAERAREARSGSPLRDPV